MPVRPLYAVIAAIAAVVLGAGAYLVAARVLDRPRPTAFGWPATLRPLAGDGARGFADGQGAAARFSDPFAIAIDAKGVLYVADAGETNLIRRIAPDGRTTTLPGAFHTPSGVAVDRDGTLYVADT